MLCNKEKKLDFLRRVWCEAYEPKTSTLHITRDESPISPLAAHHIFYIRDTWRVRFVSVNGEASEIKLTKKKCSKKRFGIENFRKKFKKNYWKFFFLNVVNKNFQTKIFIIKIYNNINESDTIFALLASFDKNSEKDRE